MTLASDEALTGELTDEQARLIGATRVPCSRSGAHTPGAIGAGVKKVPLIGVEVGVPPLPSPLEKETSELPSSDAGSEGEENKVVAGEARPLLGTKAGDWGDALPLALPVPVLERTVMGDWGEPPLDALDGDCPTAAPTTTWVASSPAPKDPEVRSIGPLAGERGT